MMLSNFSEVFLTIYISALGVLSLSHSLPKSNPAGYLLMLAFPVGYLFILVATILSLFLFSTFSPFFVLFAALTFSAATLYLIKSETRSLLRINVAIRIIVLYGLMSYLFRIINIAVFSFDSFNFIELAAAFADGIDFKNSNFHIFAWRPLYIVPAHALAQYFGQDYFTSLSPLFSVCTIAALGYFVMEHPKARHFERKLPVFLLIVAISSAVLSTTFLVQQIFYVNVHAACAYLTTVAALQIFNFRPTDQDSSPPAVADVALLFGLLISITFARLEGLIFTSLLLLFVVEFNLISTKQLAAGSIFLLLLFTVWTYSFIKEGIFLNGFTNIMRALGSMAPIAILLLVNFTSKWRKQKYSILQLAIICTLCALLYYAWTNPNQYIVSALSMLINAFLDTPWGLFWPAFIAVSCVILSSTRENPNRALLCFIFMYIGMVLFLSSFRNAYRINWKDSGNRMLLHVVPLISYLFLTEAIKMYARFRIERDNTPHSRQLR
jgi:hypothetical protein